MPFSVSKRVVLGMSGGVDSSVAAKLLKQQGHEVIGVTLKVWEEEDESSVSKRWEERGCCKVGMARHVAELLGISHQVIDTRERFQKGVIDDFIGGYIEGTTPNPCVRCNERVKFGGLFQVADDLGADFIATGHYANIRHDEAGTPFLVRGQDVKKDQSYFLYRIPPSWLSKMMFPLGEMEKPDVWKEAEAMGLPVDELKESQEICFVTQGDYRQFLKQHAPQASIPGTFVDGKGKELGQHQGVAFYTPGQRKGLGISGGSRLYVQRVEPEKNMVVLGPAEDLDSRECLVSDLNIFSPETLRNTPKIDVKFRYSSPPVSAIHRWAGSTSMTIMFDSPVRALSPGQSAVFYLGDRVLGGGIIQGPTHKKGIQMCEEPISVESLPR
ncbi:MAG TPA: tRNA 2-thiouridine(34) synthase MnmA [Nitrospirales bacterium]|nr:tRNA 2-thiouridine(34) synthase MnmA [Nitrospirales bacterium]